MARIKRVYLDTLPPAQQPVVLPLPLASSDMGWPQQATTPYGLPLGYGQQTPPHGVPALPANTGTTQIVYVPVATGPLAQQQYPTERRSSGWALQGCLLVLAVFALGVISVLGLRAMPPTARERIGDMVRQTISSAAGRTASANTLTEATAAATPEAMPDLAAQPVQPLADRAFRYDNPPSISRDQYIAIWCAVDSPACPEAGAMYDALTNPGQGLTPIDPAVEAGQAAHETVLGTAGVGIGSIKNLHGVQCHAGDNRVADSSVPWGNGCAAIYGSYTDSVKTWVQLLNREYFSEDRMTPESVVAKYAPAGADGNNPPAYIKVMKSCIVQFRVGRDRCDHGLSLEEAQALLAQDIPPTAATSATPMPTTPQAASGTREAASARVAAKVNDSKRSGDAAEIALVLTTGEPGLVLGRDSLVVTDATGQRYSLDTDGNPVTLPQGEARLTLLVPVPEGARLTLTLAFPPDSPIVLDVSAK